MSADGLFADVKYALRAIRKRPGMTVTALATLALGIGVGAAIFSIVNAVLLQPLPYADPDRLVMVWNLNPREGYTYDKTRAQGDSMAPAEFLEWREAGIFEEAALFSASLNSFTDTDDPEITHGYRLSEGGFEMLGVQPRFGRLPTPDEFQYGTEQVVVLRHNLWQRRFNSDPGVVGKVVEFGGRPTRIIGVMPPGFVFFIRQSEMLMPLSYSDGFWRSRTVRDFRVMARLKPDMTIEQAQLRADQFSAAMAQKHPDTNTGWSVRLVSLADDTAGDIRPALAVLLFAVGGVLLIMCANLANLLLVHASARSRELAIRLALGAGRAQVIRQLLSESLLLSLTGGALGLGLAYGLVSSFDSMIPDRYTHGKYLLQLEAIRIDPTVIAFAFGVAVAAGALFGLAPALKASKPDLNQDLKDSGRGSAGGFRNRALQNTLVIGEVALGVVLLVGATLLVRSFVNLYERGPGLRSENLLTLITQAPAAEIDQRLEDEGLLRGPEFYDRRRGVLRALGEKLMGALEATPGVEIAAATNSLPMQGWFQPREFTIEGRAQENERDAPRAASYTVTPNFFSTLGVPLMRGRLFERTDSPDSPPVCVVSDALARLYWPNEDPLGRRIKLGPPESDRPLARVVGVVGSIREGGLDSGGAPTIYRSAAQTPLLRIWLILKTHGDPASVMPDIRRVIRSVHPSMPIYRIRAMSDVVRDSAWRLNYSMILLSGLAGLAMLLAMLGLYGVLSYAVRERTREIGVRVALGASRGDVLGAVLKDSFKLVLTGLAIGIGVSLLATRYLSALLFGVEPIDPSTLLVAAGLLLATGLIASYLPARRAIAVSPIEALRHE